MRLHSMSVPIRLTSYASSLRTLRAKSRPLDAMREAWSSLARKKLRIEGRSEKSG